MAIAVQVDQLLHGIILLHMKYIHFLIIVADCIKRWRVLRDKYARKKRHVIPSGSGADACIEPWSLMPLLSFIDPHLKPRW